MNKIKPTKTLGYVFSLLCLVILVIHTMVLVSHGSFVSWKSLSFFVSVIGFAISAYVKRTHALYIQSAIVYVHGILSFTSEVSAFGIVMITLSASLLFAAGFYTRHGWPKVGILAAVNMLVLMFGPLMGKEHGVVIAIQWTVFITAYCLILRVLFSEEIDRLNEIEDKVEAKYTRLLGEATEIAREALDILHGLKDRVDRG